MAIISHEELEKYIGATSLFKYIFFNEFQRTNR
jgi:hypothetical protein